MFYANSLIKEGRGELSWLLDLWMVMAALHIRGTNRSTYPEHMLPKCFSRQLGASDSASEKKYRRLQTCYIIIAN